MYVYGLYCDTVSIMRINIVANFEEDYKQFVLLSIQKYFNINLDNKNYSYLKELKPHDLYFKYLTDSKRIPPANPRKVYLSKELKENVLYKTYHDSIKNIINTFEKGNSIRPFLNKDVKHIFKQKCPKDFLLNDWDLYHLHLGKLDQNAKFCARTKDVLFCRITPTDAYLIQIHNHSKSSFACRELLTILRDNWIEQYNVQKLQGIISLEKELNDSEYRDLREKGFTTIINIDGDYCVAPNFGIVSSRDSAKDVRIAMYQFEVLNTLQKHIFDNAKMIYDFIIRCNIRHKKPSKIHFKLRHIAKNILIAQDIYSKAIIELEIENQYIVEMIIRINKQTCTVKYEIET